MRTVLVTAASGNAGRHCVEALLSQGYKVVAASRSPSQLSFSRPVGVRQYDADVVTDFDALFDGIDDIVLIGPPLDGLVHQKLAPFIAAAAGINPGQLIYLSGNYLSGMTGATLEALPIRKVERQIIDAGIRHTIVRAGFFMDNYLTGFYAKMVERGEITLATGNGKSSLIAAADLGAFVATALQRGLTGEYIVTGPEALDHTEVARLLSEKTGRPVTYVPVSEAQLLALYQSRGLNRESVEYGLALYRAYANQATAAVTDGFQQATGRAPISFREYLSRQ